MKVVFFQRKPRPAKNFSIENLFQEVRRGMPLDIQCEIREMKYYSQGLFKRLYIMWEAAMNQGDVNHVTGDINFITIFLTRRKTILTIHDLGLLHRKNLFARMVLKWLWVILPARRAGVVTTVSNATMKELSQYVAIDPGKVKVIYNPISPLFVSKPKAFNKTTPRILQIGTKDNKNIFRVVRALSGLSCKFEIIGEISSALELELREHAIDFIVAVGLSAEEMVRRYELCDVLLFASTHEGFGMPIVEANAVGRVVVTSNISSMPEIAANAAHLVDPFNVESIREGIMRVIEDDRYRESLIANGFSNRGRFAAAAISKQFADLYYSLDNRDVPGVPLSSFAYKC